MRDWGEESALFLASSLRRTAPDPIFAEARGIHHALRGFGLPPPPKRTAS